MINFDEFDHIHVIKKLKQILSSWWNVELLFTDERGNIKSFDKTNMRMKNSAVMAFLEKDAAVDNLGAEVSKLVDDLRSTENKHATRKWTMTGFDYTVCPIVIENDFVGTVIALGFVKDNQDQNRLNEIRERMAAFGMTADKDSSHE
jgi:two-component system, NtrC family, response regulator HupR/HoxA